VVKVLEAAPGEGKAHEGAPGAAAKAAGRGLAVACGGGTLLLVARVQQEGKAAQGALDFLNGLRRTEVVFGT
jgi:methionyl-tRNA formyltransferase